MRQKHNFLGSKRRKSVYIVAIVVSVLLLAFVASAIAVRYWYAEQLKPVSSLNSNVVVVIPTGYSTGQIADLLVEKGVIRSARAFEWHVRSQNLREDLKAGQYLLSPAQSTQEIATMIAEGKIKKDLFTILPGQRVDQIKQALIKYGFSEADVTSALEASNYKNYPVLIAKPSNASLEGYLFPDSFQTTSTTKPDQIIRQSLEQMAKVLTPETINAFQKHGLGIHQAVTLASIVEREANRPADKAMIAQVFYNRLKAGMTLGSDVTYQYASILAGQQPNPLIDSPYNTRKYTGLPPGPISNVSLASVKAVANPTPNDYLFFVAGDDGKIYYSKTIEEHEALAKEHCKKLCSTY